MRLDIDFDGVPVHSGHRCHKIRYGRGNFIEGARLSDAAAVKLRHGDDPPLAFPAA
jgi:hypothetical protein